MSSTRRAPLILSGLLLAGFSSGCASNKQPVVVIRTPPAEHLTCKAEPIAPAVETDKTVAQFITDALDAGQDCRSQLKFVRDWSHKVVNP